MTQLWLALVCDIYLVYIPVLSLPHKWFSPRGSRSAKVLLSNEGLLPPCQVKNSCIGSTELCVPMAAEPCALPQPRHTKHLVGRQTRSGAVIGSAEHSRKAAGTLPKRGLMPSYLHISFTSIA